MKWRVARALWCGLHASALVAQPPAQQVSWRVEISDPRSGVAHVSGSVPAAMLMNVPRVIVRFPDLARFPQYLTSFIGQCAGRTLAVKRTDGPAGIEIEIGRCYADVSLDLAFEVRATYFPPGSDQGDLRDARARITPELAVIRTGTVVPILGLPARTASVLFLLPPGWIVVAPWTRASGTEVNRFDVEADDVQRVEYIGLGPFQLVELEASTTHLRVAIAPGAPGVTSAQVRALLEALLQSLGPPAARGVYSAIVVPRDFMRGGAAGHRSIVQAADPMVIAHEMLHWWFTPNLVDSDGAWLTEGFVNFYGVELARRASLLTPAMAEACFADLQAEMNYLERAAVRSLVSAARDYASDPVSQRLVYSKGALLALHLDREAHSLGKSLEAAFPRLTRSSEPLSTRDIRRLFAAALGDPATRLFDSYVTSPGRLPNLDLPASTGRSGCARFLP